MFTALERAAGTPLFDRSERAIKLTPAGRVFARSADRLTAQAAEAIRDAKRIAGGDFGSLAIAFTAASSYVFLPRFVSMLRTAMPEVSLTLREMTSPQQLVALRDEQIEIDLSRPPITQPGVGSMPSVRISVVPGL
jgi:DNA-binding transcriptional LysR family regulator